MKHNHNWLKLSLLGLMLLGLGCSGSQDPLSSTRPIDQTLSSGKVESIAEGVEAIGHERLDAEAIDLATTQYLRSGHAMGLFVAYAGGRAACARCHGAEGFVEYAETGMVEEDIPDPTAFACNTCHHLSQTFAYPDFTFRIDPAYPVPAYVWGAPDFNFGDNSNLCANCHQARRLEPMLDMPGETYSITSTHYGPHHGSQANIFAGFAFAEIPGSLAYGGINYHAVAGATCVVCHMSASTDGTGGHTFLPDENACNGCHGGGFGYGGAQADNQSRLDTLRDLLVEAGVVEYVPDSDSYQPVLGTYPILQARAYFNWIGLTEDRSLGVHNPRYVEALLTNTIEAMQAAR